MVVGVIHPLPHTIKKNEKKNSLDVLDGSHCFHIDKYSLNYRTLFKTCALPLRTNPNKRKASLFKKELFPLVR